MKNLLSKIVVSITIIALLINTLPVNTLAMAFPLSGSTDQSGSASVGNATATEANRQNSSDFDSQLNPYDPNSSAIVGELVNKRGKFTKQFQKADGLIEADVYNSAVNYQKSDGTWAEVDNTLIQAKDTKGNSILKTKDNGYMNVALGQESNIGNLISITKGKYKVSWNFDNASSMIPVTTTSPDASPTESMPTVTLPLPNVTPTDTNPVASDSADSTIEPSITASSDTLPTSSSVVVPIDANTSAPTTESIQTEMANTVTASVIDDSTSLKSKMSNNDKIRLADKSKSHVEYSNILPGINFEYYIEAEKVKEDIIVNQYSPNQSFTFDLFTNGLSATKQSDGTIALSDGNSNVFYIPVLKMRDSSENESISINVDLTPIDSGYKLTLTPDDTWMANAVYPVTIDPVVQSTEDINDIQDTYASSRYPTTNYYNYDDLRVGYLTDYYTLYDYVQFNTTALPSLRPGDVIVYAGLNLVSDENYNTNFQFDVHRVTSAWSSSTLTWNNKPSYDSTVDDYQTVTT